MPKTYGLLTLFILLSPATSWAEVCGFEQAPHVLESGPSHLLQYWDFKNSTVIDLPMLLEQGPLASYRASVSSKLNTDPLALLERYSKTNPDPADGFNLALMLRSFPYYVRPMHCLESLLLSRQLSRNPKMLTDPTEFVAVFMQNVDSRLRVYFVTDDINGLRKLKPLFDAIQSDLNAGWHMIGNLHNHSFFLDNINLDEKHHPQGVLSPSASEITIFEIMRSNFQLESAFITNGFNTISISAKDFQLFHGREAQ
jgi:hypothetical protein